MGELIGVPIWCGLARTPSGERRVSISRDLTRIGYVPLKDVLENLDFLRTWLSFPVDNRIDAAMALASELALLAQCDFVHGDINPENVFLNMGASLACLIDYDGGWVPGVISSVPTVLGKGDEFVAPELAIGSRRPTLVDFSRSEKWAVGSILHCLIYAVPPLFLLKKMSTQSIGTYLSEYDWPDIAVNHILFNQLNRQFYFRYLNDLADSPSELVESFKQFVEKGALSPDSRITARQWVDCLHATRSVPSIEVLSLSRSVVVLGDSITVRWITSGARTVVLEGHGLSSQVSSSGDLTVRPLKSGELTMSASNRSGTTVKSTGKVIVLTGPTPVRVATLKYPLREISRERNDRLATLCRSLPHPVRLRGLSRPRPFFARIVSFGNQRYDWLRHTRIPSRITFPDNLLSEDEQVIF